MSHPNQLDLLEVERRARQMQAEVISHGLRAAARWVVSVLARLVRPTVKTPA